MNGRFIYLKICDESVYVKLFMYYSVPSNLGEVACVNICSDHRKLANILLHRTTCNHLFELDTRHTIKENNDENLWFIISCNFWAFYEPGQNIHSVSFILLPLPPWDFLSFSIAWDYLQQTVWSHFLQVVPQRRREDRPLSRNNRLCRLFWQSCPH